MVIKGPGDPGEGRIPDSGEPKPAVAPAQLPASPEPPTSGVPPASGLIAHIQSAMEHQKAVLARELHDDLGGLLVGAVMDLAWAEQHLLSAPPGEVKQKLLRARQSLSAAIDLKRKLIEELRPTLLDNVGLFAALRWYLQASCKRLGLPCAIQLPEDERRFLPTVPIALFRIVQEALAVIVARKPAGAEFSMTTDRRWLTITLSGSVAATTADTDPGAGAETHYLAAIEQRVASLGGEFHHQNDPQAGTSIRARFPLANTVESGGTP